MAGQEERFNPAPLSLSVSGGKPVGFESGPELEGEGEKPVRVQHLDHAALQHDDAQKVTISRTLLVEQQVGFQHKPPPVVSGISLLLLY